MNTVHITMFHERVGQFVKDWPMAVHIKSEKRYSTYALPRRVYDKCYHHFMEYGSIDAPPTINYIKITGTMDGQPVKLFIKEKDCCKVLERLVKIQDEKERSHPLLITLKKVRIARALKDRIQPIVTRSMTLVGMAA